MLTRLTSYWTTLRRWLNLNEWTVRLLGLPREINQKSQPGLVMVQIDGLSQQKLEQALRDGRVPLLAKLLDAEHYQLHTMFSGLPSSTPSVQGELFYGKRSIVPAFSFRHPKLKRIVAMYEGCAAREIETQLQARAPGLLTAGSAYSDIYSGGASEAHFCASTAGWGEVWNTVNPVRLSAAVLLHFASVVRVVVLMTAELMQASYDFVMGTYQGLSLWHELKFIPARVVVNVLLRELCVIGAAADITRGVPIVHVNLLGYDEQAHRRGPDSSLAARSLPAIDYAIRRIWLAAHRSQARHYDVWIYSDHGQEPTQPYALLQGHCLKTSVINVLTELGQQPVDTGVEASPREAVRASWISNSRLLARLVGSKPHSASARFNHLEVADNGPLGFVYLHEPLSRKTLHQAARLLVEQQGCPMVVLPANNHTADVYMPTGCFRLPEQAEEVFGRDHPFWRELGSEMAALVHHPLAGTFLVSGWNGLGPSVSFAQQNGAHAGAGPEETRAFALVPDDTPFSERNKSYLRPNDLRLAAKAVIQGGGRRKPSKTTTVDRLRLMTYNVHGCVGMDGKLSVERIARVISRSGADIVALQELDVGRVRSKGTHQAQQIAKLLDMECYFHPAWHLADEQYGDAVLSKLPMRVVKTGHLPTTSRVRGEPRGALWVEVDLGGEKKLQVINTHLGVWPSEQRQQLETLLGSEWIRSRLFNGPRIVCGDLNFTAKSPLFGRISNTLNDASSIAETKNKPASWNSWHPVRSIDHVFVSREIGVAYHASVRAAVARDASDHLPIIADVYIQQPRAYRDIKASVRACSFF